MASPTRRTPASLTDTIDVVREYARQEVVGPLQGMGRWIGVGIAGALCLGLGAFFLSLSLLRVLQTETGDVFVGTWSFVPYLIVLVAVVIVAALSVWRIKRTPHHRKEPV